MRAAPDGAVFLWVSDDKRYARDLARGLGRSDLVIMGPADLRDRMRGLRRPVVLDHALELTADQAAYLHMNVRA